MPKLVGLQLLRAFAAIMVLIGYTIAEAQHYTPINVALDFVPWTRGVDIFFVISGFIITLSAARFFNQPFGFLWRRIKRVAPLYYFFTTLMVITLIALPGGTKETTFNLGQITSSYGFFPFAREDGRIAPVISLGWTLNYEMFFYALFAASLCFRKPVPIICSALVLISFIGFFASFNAPHWEFWTNSIILEFGFGILLANIYQTGWKRPDWRISLVLFIVGLGLLIALNGSGLPRFIAAGIPATIIVAAGTCFFPDTHSRFLILGDASYALYLSHRFTLRSMTLLLLPLLPATLLGVWVFVGLTTLFAIGVAILVHLFIERPFLTTPRRVRFT